VSRTPRTPRLRLPPPHRLRPTGPVDFVDHYYRLPNRVIFRARLRWALRALAAAPGGAVLELGFGSGVFLPSLAGVGRPVAAIDVHEHGAAVRDALSADGTDALLLQASAGALPFRSGSFDAVVAVSTLEFVPDPVETLREALRVTRPGGRVVCIVPRQLAWADRVFELLTGTNPEDDFAGRRAAVQSSLDAAGAGGGTAPRWLPSLLAPYRVATIDRP
jgi:SAM-dependent methyltransferase